VRIPIIKTNSRRDLDANMNPEVHSRAKKMAQKESFNNRLAILREKYRVKQNKTINFTQTAVSILENSKDIRISTLIDYLDSLGMRLETTACPRNSTKNNYCYLDKTDNDIIAKSKMV